ncbi:MAG TPA: flagellin [Rhodanobacteraceae bacterium]
MSQVGSILSNDGALAALNSLRTSSDTTNTLESELSSGKSINSPADNPAGYITAQGFTSQVNGLTQALSNANQGIALLQTAQGAIGEETNIVQQLNSIAVQASNGTQTPAESQSLQGVVSQLTSQVDTIAKQSQFNNINLLDGTFSGVDFQVGANNGQTIGLSIANADASAIGMQASAETASGIFTGTGTSTSAYSASAGQFTAGNLVIDGSNGQSTVVVSSATESAASVAAAINADTATTNVAAQATNSVNFTVTGSNFSFTLSNGSTTATTNAVSISADSAQGLVNAINGHTATNGISAQMEANGSITLTQSDGQNIAITDMTAGTLADSASTPNTTTGSTTAPTTALYQGVVQLQSDAGFSIDGTSTAIIGVSGASSLQSLADINVSTTSGAQKAINVIKYALQGLGAQGGQLGAVQQRLQANVNNNETTQQNLTSALSVVQDANIPQVSEQLTQQQVLQAAGIASLKNSTALEQMYGQLLP